MLNPAYSATQKLLNKYISLDPEAINNLDKLAGKVIKIEVTSLDLVLYMTIDNHHIQLSDSINTSHQNTPHKNNESPSEKSPSPNHAQKAADTKSNQNSNPSPDESSRLERKIDTILSGTLLEWIKLAWQMHNKQMQNAIKIDGDIDTAQDLQALFQDLDIDWEEMLSKLLGDPLAHQCCNQAGQFFAWQRQTGATLTENLGEYLTEEKRLFVGKLEMEDFCNDVDDIGMAIDRLEQRIKKAELLNMDPGS